MGRLIPAGTGLTHHLARRKKQEEIQQQLSSLMAELPDGDAEEPVAIVIEEPIEE